MLDYSLHSLHLHHQQRMSLYAFDLQAMPQLYADYPLNPSPPPIQVPSHQRPPSGTGIVRPIPVSAGPASVPRQQQQQVHPQQSLQHPQHAPTQPFVIDNSPASSNSQSFSHNGSPVPASLDQSSFAIPFLTDWGAPPWPSELPKPHQQVPSQNPPVDINTHSHFMSQPMAPASGFQSQPLPDSSLSGFFTNPGSLDSSDFAYLASPPRSVKSDDSLRHPSLNHSPPMLTHSPPSVSIPADPVPGMELADLQLPEPAGIKLETEHSPQASYDPRFLTSNPPPVLDSSPPQTFNGLFNPTDPPIVSQQDNGENSSLSSSEDDPSGTYQDSVVPSQVHAGSEHVSRFHRSPRLAAPIPIPNLTKKSRGRRVPTTAFVFEDGVERSRPFSCIVPGCGKCFARGEHLKRHVRSIHTNEKPHKCPVPSCGKEFSRNDNLCQHMRVHKGYRYSDLH